MLTRVRDELALDSRVAHPSSPAAHRDPAVRALGIKEPLRPSARAASDAGVSVGGHPNWLQSPRARSFGAELRIQEARRTLQARS